MIPACAPVIPRRILRQDRPTLFVTSDYTRPKRNRNTGLVVIQSVLEVKNFARNLPIIYVARDRGIKAHECGASTSPFLLSSQYIRQYWWHLVKQPPEDFSRVGTQTKPSTRKVRRRLKMIENC